MAVLVVAQPVFTGEFYVSCSYGNENLKGCARQLTDIVANKFIAKFPASRF